MHKWISRLFKIRLTRLGLIVLCIIATIQLFFSYGYYNYKHIPFEDLHSALHFEVNPKLVRDKKNPSCQYEDILHNPRSLPIYEIPTTFNDFSPSGIVNGSFVPASCNPLMSVAILVTYRNRQNQLDIFIPYIHNFLRKQNIHYRIYIIEQQDEKPWNKGMLYNIGARQAIADKFPCLILHDIDLLPLDESNLYACLKQPRHMSASIDKFRYVLIYETLVGGVLAIQSDQYVEINGFSNRFVGWGGEDDDFATRILTHNLEILRFPPYMSRYSMLVHKQEAKNEDRHRILAENERSVKRDGLDSAKYQQVRVNTNRLYTMISVKL